MPAGSPTAPGKNRGARSLLRAASGGQPAVIGPGGLADERISDSGQSLSDHPAPVAQRDPGPARRVEVEAGAVVDEGDALVLLESMKMEIPVFTEVAGVVRAVKVSSGDVVQDGDVLVEIQTS